MGENKSRIVSNQMLIRRPVSKVFNALRNPEVTTKFWFTRSSGPLEEGGKVTWYWDMYGVNAEVQVESIIENELIKFQWGEPRTTVEFQFIAISQDSTYVIIKNYGFSQEDEDLLEALKDNMGGFTFLLSAMKAWLEHGIQLNLVADKYPPEVAAHFDKA